MFRCRVADICLVAVRKTPLDATLDDRFSFADPINQSNARFAALSHCRHARFAGSCCSCVQDACMQLRDGKFKHPPTGALLPAPLATQSQRPRNTQVRPCLHVVSMESHARQ